MKIAYLPIAVGFIGLCLPAHAALIGSTVDVQRLYPDLSTLISDGGSTTVSGLVEYPDLTSFSVNITDTQLLIGSLALGNLSFTAAAFNGFEFSFSGVTITGATVNGSSTFQGSPAISIVGNNIFLTTRA
jgi:hypothetical protein